MKLYSGTKNASSWAMRAWLALREANLSFEEEVVDIRRPQRFANFERIGEFSGQRTVPVLRVGDAVISDSLAIMELANDLSGGILLPTDVTRRAEARAVMAWQHAGLSRICSRISFESAFYPIKRELTGQERAECQRLATYLEKLLHNSDKPFLFGSLSLADLMLVPTAIRLSRHDWQLDTYPETKQWLISVLALPNVMAWMLEADDLPHIWFDEYLVPDSQLRWGNFR